MWLSQTRKSLILDGGGLCGAALGFVRYRAARIGRVELVGGLEQFDEVAGWVGEPDLASAWASEQVAAERQSGRAQAADFGFEVVDG